MSTFISTSFPVITNQFNAIEIHPCRAIDKDTVEQCQPDQAEFWSLYIHLTEGGLECIADFVTEQLAINFKKFLESFLANNDSSESTNSWQINDFEERATELELNEIEDDNPKLFHQLTISETHLRVPEKYIIYDRSKFKDALNLMLRKADANIGITWTTIDHYLDQECKLHCNVVDTSLN